MKPVVETLKRLCRTSSRALVATGSCAVILLSCHCEVEPPRAFALLTKPLRGGAAPSRSACETYLHDKIDGAFNRNDLDGLYATLTPLHRHLYRRLVDRLAYAMQIESLSMKSRLVDYRTLEDSAILLVESTFHSKTSRTLDIHREWSYVVLHDQSSGSLATADRDTNLRTLVHVTVDPAHLPYADNERAPKLSWNQFRCGYCNYSLSAPDNWLMVPHRNASVGCVEAVSFHSLDKDVSVDLSIHVGDPNADATATLERLLRSRLNGGKLPGIAPWIPAAYKTENPTVGAGQLRGAVAVVRRKDADGIELERLHLVCHGPMQYLIVSHAPAGSTSVVELQKSAMQVIDSFMIEDLKLSPEDLLLRVRKHSSCRMDGSKLTFEHPQIGTLTFALPPTWAGSLKTNHFLIDMACDCPNEANHIKLQGVEPPVGHESWSPATADEILIKTLASFDAEVVDDSGWKKPELTAEPSRTWDHTRTLRLKKPIAGGRFAEVDLYLKMTKQILIALQTTTEDDVARPFIRRSVDSLTFVR